MENKDYKRNFNFLINNVSNELALEYDGNEYLLKKICIDNVSFVNEKLCQMITIDIEKVHEFDIYTRA